LSEYTLSIKQWSEEMLKFYDKSIQAFRENVGENKLNEWKIQFIQFQEDLSKDTTLIDLDIY